MANVLFFSPGFPLEMNHFARGLKTVGAQVIGLGDSPVPALPQLARESLADYIQVRNLFDEEGVLAQVLDYARRVRIDRVECLWEPGMFLAARLREALGVPGMTVAETIPFRDKEEMKKALDRAGIRTPYHHKCSTGDEAREAAEKIGYPLCVKPIAGAGSADTYRVDDAKELERTLILTQHVAELSVEEFIEGEEFTFDTICTDGQIRYWNVAWYRPRPLIARTQEWISPQTVTLRNVNDRRLRPGVEMGQAVIKALGFKTGFTHMEWFLKPNGEAVFGEIGGRPPGARSVDIMNFGSDLDVYVGWAEAAVHGTFSQNIDRKYNSAVIFKRAHGTGRIRRIEGLEEIVREFGNYITCIDFLPVGAHRRNWKQTLISDGYMMLRHPDLQTCLYMADKVGNHLQIYAG